MSSPARYMPTAHLSQSSPYSPAAHDWQDAEPLNSVLYPVGQRVHVGDFGVAAKNINEHTPHSCAPELFWDVPGKHGMQLTCFASFCIQPIGQYLQSSDLAWSAKRPASHSLQTRLPSAPAWYVPALQSVQEGAPAAAVFPGSQAKHSRAVSLLANVSREHFGHAVWFGLPWALPGMQGRHDTWRDEGCM